MLIDRYAIFRVYVESLSKNLQKYENKVMSEMGMRGIHALCLFHLGKSREGLTATQLATMCHVDKALISRTVSELSESGDVVRDMSGKGKYRSRIQLTLKGRQCLRKVTLEICNSIRQMKDEITSEELETFYKVLVTLDRYLSDGTDTRGT